MTKKKKISAEEKHYQKLNKRLTKKAKEYFTSCKNQSQHNEILEYQKRELEQKNKLLQIENDKLREITNLTDEEIKQIVKSAKKTNEFIDMTNALVKNLF